MKRSRINEIMASAEEMIRSHGFVLPSFAHWSPEEFRLRSREGGLGRIAESRMGWDITDFGQGRFEALGLVLFTLRNGSREDLRRGQGMVYAEKLLISRQYQVCPSHTHILKVEDIINRGGATLAVELYGSDEKGRFDGDRGGRVMYDGIERAFTPGEVLHLAPGESVTLFPGHWHSFWGEGGDVLVGEVSTVNDDLDDNIFRDKVGRFSAIEEDVAPSHLLVSDYDRFLA